MLRPTKTEKYNNLLFFAEHVNINHVLEFVQLIINNKFKNIIFVFFKVDKILTLYDINL